MQTVQILDKKVSFQSAAWSSISKEMTIGEVLNEIKGGKYLTIIERLRTFVSNDQLEEYNIHKKNLPGVTFCATFTNKRRKDSLKNYNHIMVLDIDKLELEEFERVKDILSKDDYVFTFWESPSKKGLKGLVNLSYSFNVDEYNVDAAHKTAFKKIQQYFDTTYRISLDESGSDTTRLCFLSDDANLVYREIKKSFGIDELEKLETTKEKPSIQEVRISSKKDALNNPHNRNNSYDRRTIQAIIKFLTKNQRSITSSYEEWYRVAIAIANSFTYDIGEKYFLSLSKIDNEKFNDINCKNMLTYCYENRQDKITFKTIEYLARIKGYTTRNQREVVPKVANES